MHRIALLAFVLAPASLAAQSTDSTVTVTAAPAAPSRRASAGVRPPTGSAHVSIDLGDGTLAEFDTRRFEVAVSQPANANASSAALPEVHLVKRAGAFTGALVQASASGQHLPSMLVSVPDSAGAAALSILLTDVVVATDRLVLTSERQTLEQQRIAQRATLAQLTSDYQEAQRQLTIAEQLGKSRVTTPQDLLRARERAAEVQQRLDLARQSYAMLESQLAAQGPMDEELTLRFARIEINGAEPGSRGAWDFSSITPPPVSKRPRR